MHGSAEFGGSALLIEGATGSGRNRTKFVVVDTSAIKVAHCAFHVHNIRDDEPRVKTPGFHSQRTHAGTGL